MILPLVTIGIPTYKRPDLLKRALHSVKSQDYLNIEVIISNNNSEMQEYDTVISELSSSIKNLNYFYQKKNLGPLNNFFFLRNMAKGKYFMWLADDDEICSNYVSSLVKILEDNPMASSAAGHWFLMFDETNGQLMKTSCYQNPIAIARVMNFIWKSDDAFFYALHRTDVLRKATYLEYWKPIKDELLNWAYVFLLDMVIDGPVLLCDDSKVRFINHDYTSKTYYYKYKTYKIILLYMLRRMNVYWLYLSKVYKKLGLMSALLIMIIATFALARDYIFYAGKTIANKLSQMKGRLCQ